MIFAAAFLCLCFSFESKASNINSDTGQQFYVNYAEPATSDYEGYITLLVQNTSTGAYGVETFFWYCAANSNGNVSPCYMYITMSSSNIEFVPAGVSSADSAYYSVGCYGITGKCFWQYASSSSRYNVNYSNNGYQIVAYKYNGNVGAIAGTPASSHTAFSVYFNDSASAVLLQEIINLLLSSNDINSDVLSTVLKIYNSVDGVEQSLVSIQTYLQSCDIRLSNIYWQLDSLLKKVDTLIAEEEESNSWLEKIFNWLQDSPEQEKQEATTQGNQSTSDATTAITDNSQGFIDSLGGLASSMSYSGTDCVWTFPAITLPAIPGVMDSMQLTTEKPIDFSYWVNQIPANLLLLIQSLLTVALIIYCFKEVYGTISYVLTLRGGGNNE